MSLRNFTWKKGNKKPKTGPGWCGSVDKAWVANQRVTGLIPSQDICLGCGPGPH